MDSAEPPGIHAAADPAPGAAGGPVDLQAASIEWDDGQLRAGGPMGVTVTWGGPSGPHLTAAALAGTLDALQVDVGVLRVPEGEVTFRRGSVATGDRSATLEDVTLSAVSTCTGAPTADAGHPLLVAREVRVSADARWSAQDAVLQPCACPTGTPILSLRARSLELVPERYAVLHGGTIRLFGAPVVPVPWWRVALSPDAFRLSLPEVGYGSQGWSAAWMASGGVAGWRVTAGPAWREDRGGRVEAGATGEPGALRGAVGWDAETGGVRGLLVGRGGVERAPPRVRLAWDVDAPSDRAYVEDYAVDYVDRGAAWRDSRLLLGVGPVEASADLADDASRLAVAGLRVHGALQPSDAVRVTPSLSASLVANSQLGAASAVGSVAPVAGDPTAGDPTAGAAPVLSDVAPLVDAALSLSVDRTRGLLRLSATARGDAWASPAASTASPAATTASPAASTASPAAETNPLGASGAAELFAAVPMWSPLGAHRVQWWPGVYASASGATGLRDGTPSLPTGATPSDLLPAGPPAAASLPAAATLGPALRADLAAGPWWTTADLRASWSSLGGFRPSVALTGSSTHLRGRLHADTESASGEVTAPLDVGAFAVSPRVGAARVPGLSLAWGGLDVDWRGWSAGGTVSADVGEGLVTGGAAFVGYTDGCTFIRVTAASSPDRALPDLGLKVTLRR